MKIWRELLLSVLLLLLPLASDAHGHRAHAEMQAVAVADLPPEARDTLRLIKQGGPFPFARDGVVFSNYELHLPRKPRGYYREYTVTTPGAHNRGPRRIVCGPWPECYYSDDHYRIFRFIARER